MDPWLDSLSEDWISQPRTSPTSSPSSLLSTKSQTRTSRYATSSSNTSLKNSSPSRTASKPLVEHTLSKINISAPRPGRATVEQKGASVNGTKVENTVKSTAQSISDASLQSVQHHSISHDVQRSSQNATNNIATPQWKKRLLHGDGLNCEHDLFSPLPLESIFKPSVESETPATFENVFAEDSDFNDLAKEQEVVKLVLEGDCKTEADAAANSEHHESQHEPPSRFPEIQNVQLDGNADEPDAQTSANKEDVIAAEQVPIDESGEPVLAERSPANPAIQVQDVDWINQSLPDDLSMGTQDFVSGALLNVRRGGYRDDILFPRRNLSVSSLPSPQSPSRLHDDAVASSLNSSPTGLPPRSVSAEPSFYPLDQNSPFAVKTPKKTQQNQYLSPEQSKASGSPLKIFGNYDTFSKNMLFRRLSQFEANNFDEDSQARSQLFRNEKQEVVTSPPEPDSENQSPNCPEGDTNGQLKFGSGSLNNYDFKESGILESSRSTDFVEDVGSRPPLSSFLLATQNSSLLFRAASQAPGYSSQRANLRIQEDERLSRIDLSKLGLEQQAVNSSIDATSPRAEGLLQVPNNRDGKRVTRSPLRYPTPKRRRTLLRPVSGRVGVEMHHGSVRKRSHRSTSSSKSKKGHEKVHGGNGSGNGSRVMALRQMVRPRTPTPSQSRLRNTSLFSEQNSPVNKETEAANVAPVARKSPNSGKCVTTMNNESRQPSLTTQDYFDEAEKIMDMIRNQHENKLSSVVEVGNETGNASEEPSQFEDSTKEPFSRPPSREKVHSQKVSKVPKLAPPSLNHLQKFQDTKEDEELALSSSVQSLRLDQNNKANVPDAESVPKSPEFESNPPNIRIHESRAMKRIRNHSNSDANTGHSSEEGKTDELAQQSQELRQSLDSSATRTIPTLSSIGSVVRRVLPKDRIAHLIPSEVAGMTYNSSEQTWVRSKSSSKHASRSSQGNSNNSAISSESDPFAGIPDLRVDVSQELHLTRIEKSPEKKQHPLPRIPPPPCNFPASATLDKSISQIEARSPTTTPPEHHRVAARASNKQNRSEEDRHSAAHSKHFEEADHEYSISEGRSRAIPIPAYHPGHDRQARAVTISFSSPLNQYGKRSFVSGSYIWKERNESPESHASRIDVDTTARLGSKGVQRGASRKSSLCGKPFSPIDEQDEAAEEKFCTNPLRSSLIVSTPMPLRDHPGSASLPPPSTVRGSNVTFHLDPLPDFTVNQTDEPFQLEVKYVANRKGTLSLKDAEASLSIAIDYMVKCITDVEPYEPYWEYIRTLNLSGKKLVTLHMLNEFCDRIEELDVSENELGQLTGAPQTLRDLKVQHNCLSNLTSWNHLTNLQYLDVSGNDLESLDGFKCLLHLRELKADGNRITDISGILGLDGLLSLSLSHNKLERVDFSASELRRLTNLDLSNNALIEIDGLGCLESIRQLNFDRNELVTFPEPGDRLTYLDTLLIRNNDLQSLNVGDLSSLRVLCVDRNHLSRINGVHGLEHLELVSMQEQTPAFPDDEVSIKLSNFTEAYRLYLSGNPLPVMLSKDLFLNLQHLSLASCGLQVLPSSFSVMFPNVRVLNLNYNGLKEIHSLKGIVRLTRLFLAGNRISRLRRTIAVLAKLQNLKVVDLRNNVLTVGYYPGLAKGNQIVLHSDADHGDRNVNPRSDGYVISDTDEKADHLYRKRLDRSTELRRRVYELLLAGSCRNLERVDGLWFDKEVIARHDAVWDRLVELEVVKINEDYESKSKATESREDEDQDQTIDLDEYDENF